MPADETPLILEIRNLVVRYGDVVAVREATMDAPRSAITALVGPSGCGKTSLLRTIAGFEVPAQGTVTIAGRTVAGEGAWIPPERRAVGMVFQEGALPRSGHSSCKDAHILVFRQGHNTGACGWLEEGSWEGDENDHKKIFIRFDLSSVPSTFTFGRAELRFYASGEAKAEYRNEHTIQAARLLKQWNEGLGRMRDGEPARKGELSFNYARQALQLWEKPGALGETDVADAESSATVGKNWPEWVTLDVTESTRHFLAHPEENFGWKISQDLQPGLDDAATTYAAGAYMFKSSEASEINLRPMLILTPENK